MKKNDLKEKVEIFYSYCLFARNIFIFIIFFLQSPYYANYNGRFGFLDFIVWFFANKEKYPIYVLIGKYYSLMFGFSFAFLMLTIFAFVAGSYGIKSSLVFDKKVKILKKKDNRRTILIFSFLEVALFIFGLYLLFYYFDYKSNLFEKSQYVDLKIGVIDIGFKKLPIKWYFEEKRQVMIRHVVMMLFVLIDFVLDIFVMYYYILFYKIKNSSKKRR